MAGDIFITGTPAAVGRCPCYLLYSFGNFNNFPVFPRTEKVYTESSRKWKAGMLMKTLKEIKWDAMLSALLYVIMGVVLLLFPETTAKTLGYLIGAVAVLAGAVSMISYLLRDAHESYYRNDFVYGLVGIAVGCFVFYKVDLIISLVPFILGLLVIVSGCGKLQDVIDMKRLNYGNWAIMLAIAAVNVVLGIVLLLNPFSAAKLLFQVIGIGLIFSGVTDGFVTFYLGKKIKKYLKDREAEVAQFEEKDE